MITTEQKKKIRSYLVSKQLPMDVIIEIDDHICTQINDLQINQDLSFQDAFFQTKKNWQKDLTLVRKSFISFRKVPKIVRDIQVNEMKSLISKSLKISLIFSALSFVLAIFLLENSYFKFLLLSNSIVSIPIFCLIIYYLFSNLKKGLVRSEIYFYNQLLLIFLANAIIYWTKNLLNIPEQSVYFVFNDIFNAKITFASVFILLEDFLTNTIGIYFLFYLVIRMKAIKKIKQYQLKNA